METSAEQLITYRLYTEEDREAILQLWKEESGWGAITVSQFDSWFLNTPYGKCLIVVAENENNTIVGQIIYSPSRMIVNGNEIKTLRVSAPILSSNFRQGNIRSDDHPVFLMMSEGFRIAYEAGYQYTYGFPALGWLALLRLFPKFLPNPSETVSYDCFAISLETPQTFKGLENTYTVKVAESFTEEYDVLWNEAVQQMPVKCGIIRNAAWLNWISGGHLNLELRTTNENKLTGYMTVKKESGLITDVFATSIEDVEKVFNYVVSGLHYQNDKKITVDFTQLKGMLTNITTPVVESIGYTKDNYRFAFSSYLLDTNIPFEKVQADQWYMTPMG